MNESLGTPLSEAIEALGEILASHGDTVAIVVVGGTAMISQGFVARATRDVDIIAIGSDSNEGRQGQLNLRIPFRSRWVRQFRG